MRSSASLSSIGLIMRSCQISDLPTSCESLPLSTLRKSGMASASRSLRTAPWRFYSRHGAEYADCCQRSREDGGPPRARIFVQTVIQLPPCSRVDASGTSQVPRQSILCLCPGPGPRPNRRPLANHGLVDAAPALSTAKASAFVISGLPRGFSTCCLRFTNDVATTHARLASGRLAGLCREGVEPTGLR